MGLFDFMKKNKELDFSPATIDLPSAGAQPEKQFGMLSITPPPAPGKIPPKTHRPGQLRTPTPTMPRAPPETQASPAFDLNKEPEFDLNKEPEPNFDQMLEGLPPPPAEMPEEQFSFASEPELKDPFVRTPKQAEQAGPDADEGFNLPDFDDKDFNEFEKLKAEQERLKAEQEAAMREQEEALRRAHEEAEEAKKADEEPEPESEPEVEPKSEPKPEPVKSFDDAGMRYLDISRYLDVRNTIDQVGTLATNTRNAVGKHSITVKSRDDRYVFLVKELNVIQDNLMFIDNKLFEGI